MLFSIRKLGYLNLRNVKEKSYGIWSEIKNNRLFFSILFVVSVSVGKNEAKKNTGFRPVLVFNKICRRNSSFSINRKQKI